MEKERLKKSETLDVRCETKGKKLRVTN